MKREITISGEIFEADEDFINLLQELNRVGLHTTQHCAGHQEDRSDSYLSIDMSNCDIYTRQIEKGKVRLVIRWNRFGKQLYSPSKKVRELTNDEVINTNTK